MKATQKPRARRGTAHLALNRSGVWCIAWPRSIAAATGVPRLESLGTTDRKEAEQLARPRFVEVYTQADRPEAVAAIRRAVEAVPIDQLASDFLRALKLGQCPPTPKRKTIENIYAPAFFGKKDGLIKFACDARRFTSTQVDATFVEQWLDAGRVRGLAFDTLRNRLVCVRRLMKWACAQGYAAESVTKLIAAIKRPRGVKGRAKADGVPTWNEIQRVLLAMSPPYWRVVAECQLRLGLRRGEVLSLSANWIDEKRGLVRVRICDEFAPKDNEERNVHTDPQTLKIAREVAAIREKEKLTATGYRMAWKRALARVARTGVTWDYRAKSHALRQFYATESVARGIPIVVVADQLGHSSVKVTEAHYIGRIDKRSTTLFAEQPPVCLSDLSAANDLDAVTNG